MRINIGKVTTSKTYLNVVLEYFARKISKNPTSMRHDGCMLKNSLAHDSVPA